MNIRSEILKFATDKKEFSRKELLENFSDLPANSVIKPLYRLLKNNQLKSIYRGVYRLSPSLFLPADEIKSLNDLLKVHFPLVNFCLWSSDVIMPFFHHIPNLNYIYIDVESDVTESAFNFLKSQNDIQRQVFFRPTKDEYYRYIIGEKAIIVRNLVSEAPLQTVENVQTASFEKILVDVCGDVEFDFMQGSEIYYFYQYLLDRNKINKSKLYRYATRRGRRKEVEDLINYTENL